jgi:hypothetical protein
VSVNGAIKVGLCFRVDQNPSTPQPGMLQQDPVSSSEAFLVSRSGSFLEYLEQFRYVAKTQDEIDRLLAEMKAARTAL